MKSPSEILEEAKAGRDPHIEKDEPTSVSDLPGDWQDALPDDWNDDVSESTEDRDER